VVAEVPDATLDLGAGGSTLAAQAVVAGTNVTLQARGGTWAQMTAPGGGSWPAKLDAKAGPASLVLDGAVDPAKRSYAGRVELTAPDLARAGDLLGRPGLPPLRDVHLAMTLPEGGLPTDISLQAGPSDLGAYFKDLMLTRLNLTAANEQAGRVEADGAVAGGPWHLASGWNRAGQRISLRGLTLTSPFGDAQGDVAVTPGAVPSISDTLVSNRVDADAIRAALRSQSPPPPPPSPGAAAAPAPPAEEGFVIPARPLPWAALRRVNADLHLTIGDLHWRGADYRNAVAHVSLQDGLLQVGPAAVSTPAGAVQFSASADARQAAPAFILNLRAGALALDPLLQAAGLPGGSDASLGVDVALQGQGVSPHDLAATLSGHAGVSMVDGEISNAVLAAVLGDVLKRSGVALDPAGRSHVRCLAVRADAEAGVVTLSTFKLDSTRLALDGSGTVNLADETLDLSLKPLIRIGAAGVAAPLQVTGPFRHPAVALEPQRGSGRVGVMLGGLAGPPEDCAAELRAARDGRPGPLPAATAIAQDKLPKPADLLRSLLR
jgi:hypothetical protein